MRGCYREVLRESVRLSDVNGGHRMATIELNAWEIDVLTKLTAKRLGQAKWNSGNDRHDLKRLLDKLEAAQPRTEAATDGH